MKIVVVAVGRLKAEYARLGCQTFFDRAQRALPLKVVETRDAHRRRGMSPDKCKEEEAKLLLAAVPDGATVVALDERGREWTSREFSQWMGARRDDGVSSLVFLVGGPDGLHPRVRKRAHRVWSLGAMTLPHELARLVLSEQIYRATTLLAGAPYHRD